VRECEQLPGNGRADTQPLDRDVGEGGVFLVPGGAAIEGAEETGVGGGIGALGVAGADDDRPDKKDVDAGGGG
jgi:hypothetical protein